MLNQRRRDTLPICWSKENAAAREELRMMCSGQNFGCLGHARFSFFVKNFLTEKSK
jgi:hypothetical protein